MNRAIGVELGAASEADQRAAKMEIARKAAVAESERWKRRELLVKQQIARLTKQAARLEQATSELDAERDVLARERDALKAALTKAGQNTENAILPYKGPNGTWRRPIVVECVGNVAKLQPQGQTFSMMELSPLINPRSSPMVLAVAREMLRINRAGSPDGAPVVPYLVFLVRPNGIRPYYEVRARLEPLGIAFGYELVEQDLVVEVPDYDDLTTWDGTKRLDLPELASATPMPRTGWPWTSATDSQGRNRNQGAASLPPDDSGTPGVWPSSGDGRGTAGSGSGSTVGGRGFRQFGQPGNGPDATGSLPGQTSGSGPKAELALGGFPGSGNRQGEAGESGSDGNSPDGFVWPSNTRNVGPRGNSGANPDRSGAVDDPRLGDGSGSMPNGSGGLSASSPTSGPGGPFSVDGPPIGGSLSSTTSRGDGSGAGLSGNPFGQPGGSRSPATGTMNVGQGGLSSVNGPLSVSRGRSGSIANPGGSPGGGLGGSETGAESDAGTGSGPDQKNFGPGGPDALPDLEPAQDGAGPAPPALGGPISGSTSSQGSAGGKSGLLANSGGPGSSGGAGGPSGRIANGGAGNSNATDASPGEANDPSAGGQARGGSGINSPGGGQPPSGGTGSPATDPGFTAYPSGPSAPGGPGTTQGSGSNTNTGSGSMSGTSNPPPSGVATSTGSANPNVSSPTSGATAAGSGSFSPSSASPFSPSTNASASGSASSSAPAWDSMPPAIGSPNTSSPLASMMPGSNSSSDSSGSSSSNSMGGQPGSSGTSAPASGMSLPSLSLNPDPDSEPDGLKEFAVPSISTPDRPARAIDVPFEIVVVCRRNDLLLHPGGYRLTMQDLRQGSGKAGAIQESLLKQELRAVVRRRAQIDPLIRPKPSVKFLVEADGGTTFWIAQRQLVFSGLDWPMSLQVAGPQSRHVFNEETWNAIKR
ncbi:MAG: hypothetical protein ACLQGP_25365 [Isosphaeraceae bacterium]